MGKNDWIKDAEHFITGCLKEFVIHHGEIIAKAASQRFESSLPAEIDPTHVRFVTKELYPRVAQAEGLGKIIAEHDKNAALKERAARLRKHAEDDWPSLERFILSGASRYAFLLLSGSPPEKATTDVLEGYRVVMTSKPYGVTLGATFSELGLPADGIKLDNSTELRQITAEEARLAEGDERRIRRRIPFGWTQVKVSSVSGLIIGLPHQRTGSYEAVWPWLSQEYVQTLRQATAFLQLQVSDELRPARFFAANRVWLPNELVDVDLLSSRAQPYVDEYVPLSREGPKHRIDEKRKSQLLELWPKYKDALDNAKFSRACSRYSLSLHRESDEDALIDHWVGLESLFAGSRDIGGIAASKIAILLAKKIEERRWLRKMVLDHYGIRSAIVHGDEVGNRAVGFAKAMNHPAIKEPSEALPYAMMFSRLLLRESLQRLLWNPNAIDELDDALIAGDLRSNLLKDYVARLRQKVAEVVKDEKAGE